MILDKENLLGILNVKCDCSLNDLVRHINLLASHFGGNTFSEEEVVNVLREIENDDDEEVLLVQTEHVLRFSSQWIRYWCVFHTNPKLKWVPPDLSYVP